MEKQTRYVTHLILTLILMFVMTPHTGCLSKAAETFPQVVEKQTQAPEGYTAVTTPEELSSITSNPVENYILMNDIDLSGLEEWNSIPEFSGTLDGNGYAVKGLKAPLITCMSGGSILNLALTDVNINAAGVTGALVGTLGTEDTEACSISNIYVTGTVCGSDAVGGIVGYDGYGSNTVRYTANYASVRSESGGAGGIIGYKNANAVSSYTDCSNYGTISGSGDGVGGILGSAYNADHQMTIDACCNTGNVTGINEVGGIAGYLVCSSSNAGSSLDLSLTANSAVIKGTSKVGGVIGALYLEDNINNYDAHISVTQSYNVGIIDCINSYSGGITGSIEISRFASAAQAVKIENCLNLGKMNNGGNIAGEIGIASGSVHISRCIGIQPYNSYTKGMVYRALAINNGTTGYCTLSDCYYYSANGEYAFEVGGRFSGTATALDAAQIKTAASFKNFDFTDTWAITSGQNNGYPYLKNLTLLPIPYSAPAVGTILEDSATEGSYKVTAEGLEVTYLGTTNPSAATVTIPAAVELNGFTYRVTSIAFRAFKNNTVLTNITIPGTVTTIDYGAFYGCSSLKTVSGCTGVTHIYKNVFRNCKKLVTIGSTANRITLPSIQMIGKRVFRNCTSIKKVYLPSQNLTLIKSGAFRNCAAMTKFNASPTALEKIEKYAFYNSKKLKTIILNTKKLSINTIGSKAFTGISSTAVFKVPSSKVSAYKKIFQNKGAGSKISVKQV